MNLDINLVHAEIDLNGIKWRCSAGRLVTYGSKFRMTFDCVGTHIKSITFGKVKLIVNYYDSELNWKQVVIDSHMDFFSNKLAVQVLGGYVYEVQHLR